MRKIVLSGKIISSPILIADCVCFCLSFFDFSIGKKQTTFVEIAGIKWRNCHSEARINDYVIVAGNYSTRKSRSVLVADYVSNPKRVKNVACNS